VTGLAGHAVALLIAAAPIGAAAQGTARDQDQLLVEFSPETSLEAMVQARTLAGIEGARDLAGSHVQIWRVPAGRLRATLDRVQRTPGVRSADVSGTDYRSLFIGADADLRLSESQSRALEALRAETDLSETRLARLRSGALGLLPLLAGFGESDNLPASGSFVLELRPGLSLVATRRSLRREGRDVARWSGSLADPLSGSPAGLAFFVAEGRNVSGFVSAAQGNFSIRPLGDGLHAISWIEAPASLSDEAPRKPSRVAPAAQRLRPDLMAALAAADSISAGGAPAGKAETSTNLETGQAAGPPVIRIAVAYTSGAAKQMRSQGARSPEAQIQLAIDTANGSFVESGIQAVLKLADTRQTVDIENGEAEADVRALLNRKDHQYDEIPRWRREIGANAVMLIVANSDRCGWGPAVGVTAAQAYAVVMQSCIRTLVIPHELGHLIGAGHDDDENPPFSYGRGFVSPKRFQTIMGNSTTERRVAIWAGPNILWQGLPTGTVDRNNDARVINDQARAFSRFREE